MKRFVSHKFVYVQKNLRVKSKTINFATECHDEHVFISKLTNKFRFLQYVYFQRMPFCDHNATLNFELNIVDITSTTEVLVKYSSV